jgi:3-oxoacyl-[acyl-carrier protein] reductase
METLSGKLAAVLPVERGALAAPSPSVCCAKAQQWRSAVARLTRRGRAVAAMKPLGRVFGHPADITHEVDQVKELLRSDRYGISGLDILVNNAGEGVFRKVADMTPEEWHRNIDLNLNGAFYCSREALARFAKRGGGFIVYISSLAGKNAFSGGPDITPRKPALNLFAEALMLDHRNDGVRVCTIMPGSVDTAFGGDSARRKATPSG